MRNMKFERYPNLRIKFIKVKFRMLNKLKINESDLFDSIFVGFKKSN